MNTEANIRKKILAYLQDQDLATDVAKLAKNCSYSIIENFIPGGPGTCGDILTVVFEHVDAIEVFLIKDNGLKLI